MTAPIALMWYDLLEEGQQAIYGSHSFTREAIIAFARQYDPQSFHLSEEGAAASHFGRLAASGWHTASAAMKCTAAYHFAVRARAAERGEPLPPLGPSPGFENLQWLKPVHVGDTVTYSARVTGKRPMRSRPGWGLLFTHLEGHNQHGVKVIGFDGKVMVAIRQQAEETS